MRSLMAAQSLLICHNLYHCYLKLKATNAYWSMAATTALAAFRILSRLPAEILNHVLNYVIGDQSIYIK